MNEISASLRDKNVLIFGHTVERNEILSRPVIKIKKIFASLCDENNTVNDSWKWCDRGNLLGYFRNHTKTIKHDVTPDLFYKATEFIDLTRYTLNTTAIYNRKSRFEVYNIATRISISPDNTVNDSWNWCDECHLLGCVPNQIKTIKHDVTPDLFYKAKEFIDLTRYTLTTTAIYNRKSRFEVYNIATRISISPDNTVNDSWNWCDEFHFLGYFLKHIKTIKQEITQDLFYKASMCIDLTRYTLTTTAIFIRKSRFEVYNIATRISISPGTYDNMMGLGRILIAIGGLILLQTHLSDVNDDSNLRAEMTDIQVTTFSFVGLILLMLCLKLDKYCSCVILKNLLRVFLDNKADINTCSYDRASPLCIACQDNDIKIVNNKADINSCDNSGASPLFVTYQNNHIEKVKVLLNNKVDIITCDDSGASPLFVACQQNHKETAKVLLDKKAHINKCMDDGAPPLDIACQNNHIEIVKLLLDNKADIYKYKDDKAFSLCIACQKSQTEIVRILLDNKTGINKCKDNRASFVYDLSEKSYRNSKPIPEQQGKL
ncbi:uncharacterized protein LOC127726798 [Mytilus californianus]|uniref:uncharacterized protein LOC127726798 n=1 Tax=Mytilus californianus TaxID=6549 RepID=UPI0022470720|nr:uncharacterized protein LOC127726798 [Mytilus californianus]